MGETIEVSTQLFEGEGSGPRHMTQMPQERPNFDNLAQALISFQDYLFVLLTRSPG
jgi:hypothetical protein